MCMCVCVYNTRRLYSAFYTIIYVYFGVCVCYAYIIIIIIIYVYVNPTQPTPHDHRLVPFDLLYFYILRRAEPSLHRIIYISKRIKSTNLFIHVGFIFREDYNIMILYNNNNERAIDNRLVAL